MSTANGAHSHEEGRMVRDDHRLLIHPLKDQKIMSYHLELLQEKNYDSILLPRILNAYQPGLLLYNLDPRDWHVLNDCSKNHQMLLRVLQQYCVLRQEMEKSLLDYRFLQLGEKAIYIGTPNSSNEGEIRFLYLPFSSTDSEAAMNERHAEELSRLLEKTILACQSENLLSAEEIAAWIHSSYSSFSDFKDFCISFYEKYVVTETIKTKDGRQENKRKTIKEKSNPAQLLVAAILLFLLLANLFMQEDLFPNSQWSKLLAFSFICVSALTTAWAIFHPKSPFQLELSRFQKEHESELAEELNHPLTSIQKSTSSKEVDQKSENCFYPAYLLTVPSHQGMRLRSVQEIASSEVEVFIFSNPLKLGASSVKADHSLGYKNEADWHSSLSSNKEGACLEYRDEETVIYIDNKRCETPGRYALPKHCLLRFGPALREFYRED